MLFSHFKKYQRLTRCSRIKSESINKHLELALDALSKALQINNDERVIKELIFNAVYHLESSTETNNQILKGE